MPTRLARYILASYLRTLGVVLAAIVGIFLVIDFADRAHHYTGPGVVRDVSLLYACKALVVGYQLLPAALLLAAGACISGLRRRGEVTALGALAVGPGVLYAGVLTGCFLAVAAAIGLDQMPVRKDSPASALGWAGQQVDVLTATRFRQWGDFAAYYGPQQWFRGGNRVYFLRRQEGAVFVDVSIFTIGPNFTLTSRVDAERMEPVPDGSWRLVKGAERTFPRAGESALTLFAERVVRFPEDPAAFRLRAGRPEQMTLAELRDEIGRRERLALPTTGYLMAQQNKLAYPALGLPAAALAMALALRRNRKGHLTTALLEGVGVVAVLWCATVVFRALASSGSLSPPVAAWAPVVLLSAVAAAAVALLE